MVNPAAAELKVMIVDANVPMRRIIKQLLQQLGLKRMVEAENGAHGLELLANPKMPELDFIVCEMKLDEQMDGLEFCRKIRRGKGGKQTTVPIVLLSDVMDEMIVEVATQVGISAVCQKPPSPANMIAAIDKAIGFDIS